jgi:nucleotide-binding universal stress UspA family protein/MFS family permease
MSFRGPLAGRYAAVAAMVMFALIPYLALSAALNPLTGIIAKQLHTSLQTLSLGSGLGNAAYAVGTVLSVQFAQHLPQRRMLLGYAVMLLIGSVLAASAQDATMFIVGHMIQGLCTSLLLIAAVPPLAIGYPKDKLRDTAVIMNMCIFGAVALGPFIGGLQANSLAWRPLFWIVAGISALALVLVVLTFEDAPPANPDAPRDLPAIVLAAVGCFAAFTGASELESHRFLALVSIAPLIGGLLVIFVLVTYQFRAKRPLLTVRSMLTSSIPVAGIGVALFAAAASVSATALTAEVLAERYSPLHIGLLYLPELGGAVLTAFILGRVITRKAIHYLPAVGMVALAAGIAVFRIEVPSSQALALVGSALTGFGLGATVAPALFVAGFSLPSANLQRVFAIVELMRAVAAFMIAPIFIHYALTVGGSLNAGTASALWIGLALAIVGLLFGVAIYALSGARPQKPDLDGFLAGVIPAWYSPPLLGAIRAGVVPEAPAAVGAAAAVAGNGIIPVPSANAALATNGNGHGPILIAYDGSERSKLAIERAASQLPPGREALVVTAWRPVAVGFHPQNGTHFDADDAHAVKAAAEQTAAHGAALAGSVGFRAESLAVEEIPTWQGIVDVARDRGASLIVLGTHRRSGLAGHLFGSVATEIMRHSDVPTLIVHEPV